MHTRQRRFAAIAGALLSAVVIGATASAPAAADSPPILKDLGAGDPPRVRIETSMQHINVLKRS
ncbi:hypothetical protein [Nonomuraea candida]|uniref:hypothetical protein n=1 Tax=Nonomuraea candida TaxID=359159 RepID=UPI0005B9C1E1|nr:hypothetical protein [Nonomuraea candida]